MLEAVTALQRIDVYAERIHDVENVEGDHKHKKHKKEKKHKEEKNKKHRREKERKNSKDGSARDSAGRRETEERRNGFFSNGGTAANTTSSRATRADSEPESGEIPVENSKAENEIVTAHAPDLSAEDVVPTATLQNPELEEPSR